MASMSVLEARNMCLLLKRGTSVAEITPTIQLTMVKMPLMRVCSFDAVMPIEFRILEM